ncbi:MAG: PP2C family serine/threonine-protein phosphatase [Sedimentitalea sp.]
MTCAFKIDAATALNPGARDYQEDAVVAEFSSGAEFGFAVLADGMGGHAAGEVASKIVVNEVFSALMLARNDLAAFAADVTGALRRAADTANGCLRDHVARDPASHGMGATLVAPVIVGDQMHWISVGDSPLFLFRDGVLSQLNQDHSLGPKIDLLVRMGELDPDEGRVHPDRNVLTSVLFGQTIAMIDCPPAPVQLCPGDVVIVASDGLQFLSNSQIEAIVRAHPLSRSDQLADLLMQAVLALEDPDLDNVAMSVIRVLHPAPIYTAMPARHHERVVPRQSSFAKMLRSPGKFLNTRRDTVQPEGQRHER